MDDPLNPPYDMSPDEMWDINSEETDDHYDVTDPREPDVPEGDDDA